jgi:hypothetical protein
MFDPTKEVSGLESYKNARRRIDLYWKIEWLRKLLGKYFINKCYRNEGRSYWLSIMWSFICGYSLMDSFYYNFRTPQWIKKAIRRIEKIVI